MHSSYFIPLEKVMKFMADAAMNSMEGVYVYGLTDPSVKRLLPPPLEPADPAYPMFMLYAVNIREPTFAPWYMEAGVGVMAKCGNTTGLYFFNLQLSGPGALMGAFTGREFSGLPKKICDRIRVERTDAYAHCFVERGGVKLVEVEMEMGRYNHPAFQLEQENCQTTPGGKLVEGGGCLLHRYGISEEGRLRNMEILYYDSPMRFHFWEPAAATVKLASAMDDPWGDIPLTTVLGAGWARVDNSVRSQTVIHRYQPEAGPEVMQYLYSGRYDRSLLCREHQRYE